MKKNLIIPIVAAIMAAIFAIVLAIGVFYMSYKEVWTDAYSVYNFIMIENDLYDDEYTFGLVCSYDELIEFSKNCNEHFSKEDKTCECRLCKRLYNYDNDFFEENALIICSEFCPDIGFFVLGGVKVRSQTLYLDLLYIPGIAQGTMRITLFIEVKKSKVEGVTNKAKTVNTHYGNLNWHHKVILEEKDAKLERFFKRNQNTAR